MQESGYRLSTKRCHRGLIKTEEGYSEVRSCSDFGISQIHYKTAASFKFDIKLLTTDLAYSVEAGAIVLSDFHKRYAHRENHWWTRYNASSPHKRNIYKGLVVRYL